MTRDSSLGGVWQERNRVRKRLCSASSVHPPPSILSTSLSLLAPLRSSSLSLRASLLSPFLSWPGLDNWLMVVTALAGAKLLLQPAVQHGVEELQASVHLAETDQTGLLAALLPLLVSTLYLLLPLLLTYRVELLLALGRLDQQYATTVHCGNLSLLLLLPVLALRPQCSQLGLLSSTLVCCSHIVLLLKLVSYIQVSAKRRQDCHQDTPGLADILYFWLCPTLCYTPLPPSPHSSPRPSFLLLRLLELCVCGAGSWEGIRLLAIVTPQLLRAAEQGSYLLVLERFLTLSLTTALTWMLGFYLIFFSLFNSLAELCRFADRTFYLDWWSSPTIDQFWRRWNLPVYRWCSAHLYRPLLSAGWGKLSSTLAVFLTSAVLHEYLFSVPLGLVGSTAFLGMLAQPVLVMGSRRLAGAKGDRVGNLALWFVLIFGNSVGVVTYYEQFQASGHCTAG